VRDVVELGQQVPTAVGEVSRERLLVGGEQGHAPRLGIADRLVEPALLADTDQDEWRLQADRAHRRCGHAMGHAFPQRRHDRDPRGEMTHHVPQRLGAAGDGPGEHQ
jgi:hypothetical protein